MLEMGYCRSGKYCLKYKRVEIRLVELLAVLLKFSRHASRGAPGGNFLSRKSSLIFRIL